MQEAAQVGARVPSDAAGAQGATQEVNHVPGEARAALPTQRT